MWIVDFKHGKSKPRKVVQLAYGFKGSLEEGKKAAEGAAIIILRKLQSSVSDGLMRLEK